MTLEQIIARLKEIRALLDSKAEGLDVPALEAEVRNLEGQKAALEDIERRNALAARLAANEVAPTSVQSPVPPVQTRTFAPDSAEYRTAWCKEMLGLELTAEERTAFVHTTGTTGGQTAGYTVPTTLLNTIWDLIDEKHSILGDITIYRTGTILEVTKRTAIAAGDAGTVNEATAPADDENNTFAKVTLSGKDFAKTVEISYALGIMSIDGFEQFITNEIADRLGAALARDVIAQIGTDYASATNAVDADTSGVLAWTDLTNTLATLKNVSNIKVYASQTTIYKYIVGMVDDAGRPIFQQTANEGIRGMLIGFPVKVEDAITDDIILIGDPKQIVGNMVQDIMVESDRDIKKHVNIFSGYARFQCALLAPRAFAKLDVTP